VNEDKASRYHRAKRRAAVVSIALTTLLLAAVLWSGASVALAERVGTMAGAGAGSFSAATIAIYVALLALVHEALTLPVAVYYGFGLDRRYGLSTETFTAWLRDRARAATLGLGLAIAGAEIVIVAIHMFPRWWWLVSAAAFSVAMCGLATLAPVALLPLFYRFAPLGRDSLRTRLISLSRRAGVPVLGVYEWALGQKTRRANAALVGMGRTRRILLSDTLLAGYSDDEIEVILAHEIGHHVHGDIRRGLVGESLLMVAAFYAAALALAAWWQRLGMRSPDDPAVLPLLLLAGGGLTIAATPAVNAWSRRSERRADRFALTVTQRPAAFISAMKRLATQNLAEERPSRAAVWLFHSHPSIDQRIEAAQSFAAHDPVDGSAHPVVR
jgi:STE24 endopeptidase